MLETILNTAPILGIVAIIIVSTGFILFMCNYATLKKGESEYHDKFVDEAKQKFKHI